MKLNAYLAIMLAATLGGLSGVFIKLLNLPSTSITFFRLAVPVVILLGYFSYKKIKLFQGDYKPLLLASGLNAVRMFFYFIAFLYTSIGNAEIILFTWPIFATIFSGIYLKEKISPKNWLLIFFAFLGIVVMFLNKNISFSNADFIGMGAMLISAVVYSVTVVIFKKHLDTYSKSETIFYQNIVGAVIFLPFIFINKPTPSFIQFSIASFYGFLIGIVVFTLFFYSLKRLKMGHFSLFTYWEVPAALIFSMVFFGETITWNMVVGGLFIVLAGWLLQKQKR